MQIVKEKKWKKQKLVLVLNAFWPHPVPLKTESVNVRWRDGSRWRCRWCPIKLRRPAVPLCSAEPLNPPPQPQPIQRKTPAAGTPASAHTQSGCCTPSDLWMAPVSLFLSLLLVCSLLCQGCGQHWSFGLRPGGKRAADHVLDTHDTVSSHLAAPVGGAKPQFIADVETFLSFSGAACPFGDAVMCRPGRQQEIICSCCCWDYSRPQMVNCLTSLLHNEELYVLWKTRSSFLGSFIHSFSQRRMA